jgi:hypothetical protein
MYLPAAAQAKSGPCARFPVAEVASLGAFAGVVRVLAAGLAVSHLRGEGVAHDG